ncbi:hypothetical protein BDW66DRAFT_93513 [Aspergillus desertorum]
MFVATALDATWGMRCAARCTLYGPVHHIVGEHRLLTMLATMSIPVQLFLPLE